MSIQFHDAGDVRTALLLTMLGAAGTALGGLIVVAQPDMSLSRLGLLQARGPRCSISLTHGTPTVRHRLIATRLSLRAQGLAGGLMLCISFVDLLPASMEAVGFWRANIWFYAGVGFFAMVVYFIPEPAAAEAAIAASEKASTAKSSLEERKHRKEVLMSGIITAIGAPLPLPNLTFAMCLAPLHGLACAVCNALGIPVPTTQRLGLAAHSNSPLNRPSDAQSCRTKCLCSSDARLTSMQALRCIISRKA